MLGLTILAIAVNGLVAGRAPGCIRSSPACVRSRIAADSRVSSRRDFGVVVAGGVGSALLVGNAPAYAAGQPILVAGATGKTGRLVCKQLCARSGVDVLAGVRSEKKASEIAELKCTSLRHLDVTESVDAIAKSLEGVQSVVCALGFAASNPLKMSANAHEVDNVGTCKLIDASAKAGVKQLVMVSSILTNGRAWGQEKSPGFVITNAFGGVLDEKLVAEQHLRSSGLAYTIVRPAGLRDAVGGPITVSGEDTLNSGEVARASVAEVCVEALFATGAKNKVFEIFEADEQGAAGTPKDRWFA